MVLFFAHILFVVNRTVNATAMERLQQYLERLHSLTSKISHFSAPENLTTFV